MNIHKFYLARFTVRMIAQVVMALAASAHAADVTQTDIGAAKATVESARKALEHGGASVGAIPFAPNLNALPSPAISGAASNSVDIESLARHFDRQGNFRRQSDGTRNFPHLLAFVSLGMPRASLERLVEDAARTHTTLVLRGMMSGNMELTLRTVRDAIGKHRVAWFIDPAAFTRFGIAAVPTYVLLKRDAVARDCGGDQCFSDDDFAKVSGDVTIDYALDQIATQLPNYRDIVAALRSRS